MDFFDSFCASERQFGFETCVTKPATIQILCAVVKFWPYAIALPLMGRGWGGVTKGKARDRLAMALKAG